MTGSL